MDRTNNGRIRTESGKNLPEDHGKLFLKRLDNHLLSTAILVGMFTLLPDRMQT